MESRSIRVLVLDDDADTRFVLTLALRDAGYEVTASGSPAEARVAFEGTRPDVALLDVAVDGRPAGYAFAQQLRRSSDVPIIFVSALADLEARLTGFGLGADDYVAKPFAMPELVARVQAVLQRAGRTRERVWEIDDLVVDADRHEVTRAGATIPLTPTEFSLLVVLCRHHGRVVSKIRLLEEVWGFRGYGPSVVEVRLSDLRRKLEAHGPRLIHTVRGVGYTLRPVAVS